MQDKLESVLKNISIRYLGRYSTSSFNLAKHLRKKLKKIQGEEYSEETNEPAIAKTIQYLTELGYLNDSYYAKTQATNLINKGKSYYHITNKLQEKGIDKQGITELFKEKDIYEVEEFALLKLIKKRRLFQYRQKEIPEETLKEQNEKEMNILLRAGFSYDIIKSMVKKDKEELEDIYYTLEKQTEL